MPREKSQATVVPPFTELPSRQLWTSDGTVDGTRLVAAINPATLHNLPPHNLFNFNGSLYFTANS